ARPPGRALALLVRLLWLVPAPAPRRGHRAPSRACGLARAYGKAARALGAARGRWPRRGPAERAARSRRSFPRRGLRLQGRGGGAGGGGLCWGGGGLVL